MALRLNVNDYAWYLGVAAAVAGVTAIVPDSQISRTSGSGDCGVHVSIQGTALTGSAYGYGDVEALVDFGNPSDPRTCLNSFGVTVPLQSRYGTEWFYNFPPVDVVTNRTITINYRHFTGTGMLTAQRTHTFVQSPLPAAGATTLQWMYLSSGVDGDDTHDGQDPNGFNCVCTWDHVTKKLTANTGSPFLPYVQSNAVLPSYPLSKTNIVCPVSGTAVVKDRYNIVSATGQALTLDRDITSNGTNPSNVVLSTGPKKSYKDSSGTVGRDFLDGATGSEMRILFVNGNSTWNTTGGLQGRQKNRMVVAYGTGASPIFKPDPTFSGHSSTMLGLNIASGGVDYSDWSWYGCTIDSNSIDNDSMFDLTDSAAGTMKRLYFYECVFKNHVGAGGILNHSMTNSVANVGEVAFVRCDFENPNVASNIMYVLFDRWASVVGCTFNGGNGSNSQNHYIYLDGGDNREVRYNYFGPAISLNYAVNHDSRDGVGLVSSYFDTSDNRFHGPTRGADASNTNNNGAVNGYCNEVRFAFNFIYQLDQEFVFAFGLGRCYDIGNRTGSLNTAPHFRVDFPDDAPLDIHMTDNYGDQTSGADEGGLYLLNAGTTRLGRIWGNVWAQRSAGGYSFQARGNLGNIQSDHNWYFNAQLSTAWLDKLNSNTPKSMAQWMAQGAAFDADMITAALTFVDATNGVFQEATLVLVSTEATNRQILAVGGGTYVDPAGVITVGDVITRTVRIFNTGHRSLTITAGALDIHGDFVGTPHTNGADVTLWPGQSLDVPVTIDTATAGVKTITIGAPHNRGGSPFNALWTFDVQDVPVDEPPSPGRIFPRSGGGRRGAARGVRGRGRQAVGV